VLFRNFAAVLRTLEETPSRRSRVALLAKAFRGLSPAEVGRAALILTGAVAPSFSGIELGMAETEAAKALAAAVGLPEGNVRSRLTSVGDIGALAAQLIPDRPATLELGEVFEALMAIARDSGQGAQGRKRAALASLLSRAGPDEARALLRIVTGKLRVGAGEAAILDGLAEAFLGQGASSELVARAYNLTSDLAETASRACAGEDALRSVRIEIGKPVRMMLAGRLPTVDAIVERLGPHAGEYKYDGERLQIHGEGGQIRAFSRRGEDVTHQIPEIAKAVRQLGSRRFILEAEAVVVDPASGALQPFQEVLNRRVKAWSNDLLERYPLRAFVFDLLHLDGEDLIDLPYRERRARLERFLEPRSRLALASMAPIEDAAALEAFFDEAKGAGAEGVMCKALDGRYTPGERGFAWVKYKGPSGGSLTDTLDLVVVGAWWGRGRRGGAYGSLLMAVYNADEDRFETISRLGAGLADEHLRQLLPALLDPLRTPSPPPRVVATLRPDVWFMPAVVLEVRAQELTRSPMHTAGASLLGNGRGLALRFPRFVRYREDKEPTDATTTAEVVRLFRMREVTRELPPDEAGCPRPPAR
jgi:DNA ligase-1